MNRAPPAHKAIANPPAQYLSEVIEQTLAADKADDMPNSSALRLIGVCMSDIINRIGQLRATGVSMAAWPQGLTDVRQRLHVLHDQNLKRLKAAERAELK